MQRVWAASAGREREFIELEIIQFLQQAPGRCTHCIIATLRNNFYYWGLPDCASASHAPSIHPRPKSLPASLQSSLVAEFSRPALLKSHAPQSNCHLRRGAAPNARRDITAALIDAIAQRSQYFNWAISSLSQTGTLCACTHQFLCKTHAALLRR